MNQSSINTNQIQFIISDKVRLTEFNPSKSYAKSVYIIYDNIVYLSKVDITPGEFNPEQWEKISSTDELAKKQDKIQATGVDNLLTAPEEEGGQPGIIPINSFEPAFEILSKEKGGTGSDLTAILTQDNNGDILVIDEQGNISNVERLERVSLSQEINDSLDLANTSVQPDVLDSAIDNVNTTITTHIDDTNNPHAVTKAQVGLGNVDNTADIDKPISNATREALDSLEANFDANIDSINAEISSINEDINELDERKADKATTLAGYGITDAYTKDEINTELDKKLDETVAAETYATIVNLNSHTSDTSNPHSVTKAQVGLGNVNNTSDLAKPISNATQSALDLKANISDVEADLETKQDTLVSGTNIKTINNNTILGSGNIQLQTELSGTEGNVVIYTSTTGQLNELGFDETPTLDSNSLLTSSVVYNALLDKINYTDIVNDVTTGGVNKVLSAEQGKYLNNRITQAMQSTHNRGVVLNALTSQGKNYSVTNATINNGGTGYRDGDALLLVSEELKIDSIIVVETIDSNGAITAITLSKGGSFVSDPAGTGVSYVGGSGSGATFDITSSLVDNITLEDITNPQPNDFATVIQDELHNNVIYVWQYADFNGDGTYNWVSGYPVQTDQRDFIVEPITVNELATNAVSTVKIVDGSVTLNKLASNSVNGTKIVANTINDSHIAADANIAQSKIANLITDLNSKANQATTYNKTEVDDLLDAKLDSDTATSTYATQATVTSHINNKNNPHAVTKAQVGLGNVDNTSDIDKPVSTAQATAINNAVSTHNVSETAHSNQFSQYRTSANQDTIDNQIKSDIANLQSTKADKATTLAGYGITDAYTKTQVDAKVSSVYRFRGSVATYANLPTTGQVVGDVWNVEDTGANYAWSGTEWDKLSETVDLTPYLTKEDAASTYATITTVNGKQDTLTAEQLAAVNSGITTAKVASYDAYAGEISAAKTTADKADNAAEVAQQTANLAGQEAAQALSGLVGKVNVAQGTANAGKLLGVGDDGNVVPVDGVSGTGRNIGDIFWTTRTDSGLNGAVEANGAQYNFADVNGGDNNVQTLLASGALPSVSIAKFDAMVAEQGGCDSFGYGTDTKWTSWELLLGYVYTKTASYEVGDPVYDAPGGNIIGYITRIDSENRTLIYYDKLDGKSGFAYINGTVDGPVDSTPYFKVPKKLGRVLVRSQKPTADNNYTWFNLYSDGWVEQGGILQEQSIPPNDYRNQTLTLPIEMADTNYTVTFGAVDGNRAYQSATISRTTTGGKVIQMNRTANVTTAIQFSYIASGYAAASEYTPDKWDYQNIQVLRPMVQLFNGATDEAVAKCTEVLSDVAGLKLATDGINDFVVESQEPTSGNGYTWYRKYKSGWVEQGGQFVNSSTVTLPIPMADTNYSAFIAYSKTTRNDTIGVKFIATNTQNTTNFTIATSSILRVWQVSGMSAQ